MLLKALPCTILPSLFAFVGPFVCMIFMNETFIKLNVKRILVINEYILCLCYQSFVSDRLAYSLYITEAVMEGEAIQGLRGAICMHVCTVHNKC